MSKKTTNINLIQAKASGSENLAALESSLRKSAFISLGLTSTLGVVIAILFFITTLQNNKLESQRKTLISQINAAKNKEGLLLSIKDRIKIVTTVMAAQRPWATVLDMLAGVISPTSISRVSADDQNKISVDITVQSLDEVLKPIEAFIQLSEEGKIKHAQLVSVQFTKEGTIIVTVSFTSNFL